MAGNELINRQEAIDYFVEHTSYVDEDGKRVPSENILRKMWTEVFSKIPSVESEHTAKVIEHDASITDTDGYKYYRTECLCGNCKKKVLSEDDYCSHCGARLDWE